MWVFALSDMERILTVEEVAGILRVKPFTVRQMFREKRLSGFKIGKAWRITEEALENDIDRMKSSSGGPRPGSAQPVALDNSPQLEEAEELLFSPASTVGAETGSLVVFSEVPGQEVLLDGVRRGITTLSLISVPVGTHRLDVGGVSKKIEVRTDIQMKVHQRGKRLETLGPPQPVSLRPNRNVASVALESYRLRIHLVNRTDYAGEFQMHLRAGDARRSEEMFVENRGLLAESGLSLRTVIAAKDRTAVFDGLIKAQPADRLEVSAPDQPACNAHGPWAYVVGPDMDIELSLAKAGLLRTKNILRRGTATPLA